jgi:fructooligosaccharide transport system substrate-binding protein
MRATRRQAITAAGGFAASLLAAPRARAATELKTVFNAWPLEQIKPLFDSFAAANPEITPELEGIPSAALLQTLDTRLGARTAEPDLYSCPSQFTASYAVHGHALALDDVIDEKRFVKAALDAARFRRKLYSAPFASSCQLLFYNRALFREAHIEPPPPDVTKRWTWEQVVEAGRSLADPAKNRWGLVFEQPERPYQMLPFGESLGGSAMSAVGLQATGHIDGPEFVEGFSFLQRMYTEWKIVPPGLAGETATADLFGSGQAAMFIGGTWNFDSLPEHYRGLDWGVAPHPFFARGKPVTPTGSWHLAVNPRTQNHDATVRFINYMTGDDAQLMWFRLRPHPPVLLSVWSRMPEAFASDGWRIVHYELEHTAVPCPASPGYREFDDLLGVTLRELQTGGNVAVLLTTAAQRIDEQLDKYMN